MKMCEECEEFPVQYVAYFNKAGGKLWRPAQKVATTPWAIDICPVEPPPDPPPQAGEGTSIYPPPLAGEGRAGVAIREVRGFVCDEPSAPSSEERGA
jgi:hypothetical protein